MTTNQNNQNQKNKQGDIKNQNNQSGKREQGGATNTNQRSQNDLNKDKSKKQERETFEHK